MSDIETIINKLKELYPDYNIVSWIKENRGKIYINDKLIIRFDTEFIQKQVSRYGKDGITDIIKIWAEFIETRYIEKLGRFRIKYARAFNLSYSQIKYAIANTKSNAEASRFLNVSLTTYKRYAKKYGLYDDHNNKYGKGIIKHRGTVRYELSDIFLNKHPFYPEAMLKHRLIKECILEERCEICGYSERRIFDNKMSIILDFIDGNKKNMSRENLRFICYNCHFNLGHKLSDGVKKKIRKQYKHLIDTNPHNESNANIIQNIKVVDDMWEDLNPPIEPSYITNITDKVISKEEVEDIWKQFNS